MQAQIDIEFDQLVEIAKQLPAKQWRKLKEKVEETEIRMGAEDFGYYSQKIPGCFFRLGTANKKKGITAGVHTPLFNIDEDAIEIGMGIMACLGSQAGL